MRRHRRVGPRARQAAKRSQTVRKKPGPTPLHPALWDHIPTPIPRDLAGLRRMGFLRSRLRVFVNRRGPGTQGWGTFLQNHFNKAVAIDFLVTYTSRFELFWVFLVLSLDRRKILHFNVTKNPTSQWTARQMIEAFPYASEPYEYVFRDRNKIYGMEFQNTLQVLGLK